MIVDETLVDLFSIEGILGIKIGIKTTKVSNGLDDVLHESDFLLVSDVSCGKARRLEDLHPHDELRRILLVERDENVTEDVDVDARRDAGDAQ